MTQKEKDLAMEYINSIREEERNFISSYLRWAMKKLVFHSYNEDDIVEVLDDAFNKGTINLDEKSNFYRTAFLMLKKLKGMYNSGHKAILEYKDIESILREEYSQKAEIGDEMRRKLEQDIEKEKMLMMSACEVVKQRIAKHKKCNA